MFRKLLVLVASLGIALAAVVAVAYVTNPAPVVPTIAAAEAVESGRPFVVKLHAQWCPICRIGKGAWSQIEEAYAGRVNLLVLDFTSDATTEASRAEAKRLGLGAFFDEYAGVTGPVAVLDGRTRDVTAFISGRDFAEYRAAIDERLAAAE
jgi:thiol-disulfide isomerase/thioredoxin